MTNHGDDCYFFYYSTCTKGDGCPFRHCEAAMGSETVCNLWQEGRCFRTVCKFRHMEITKNRKEIACYWENQPAGCQKPHCAFSHEKPRYIDGVFVPPDKSVSRNEEQPHEDPAPPPAAPLPTATNPQIRGVIKAETQEPVPSPTHPPVVINPADDDEDEDDQFSEGEDGKVGPSPRKLPKSDASLNFGVSTLEEIRLRKALKASMKRAGYPIQTADSPANGEKENIQAFFRPSLYDTRDAHVAALGFEETGRPRVSVAERLGRKTPTSDQDHGGEGLRRSLAGRLGRIVDDGESLTPPQKALKPVKDRLGFPGSVTDTQPDFLTADTDVESKKPPEQIRIKTLEEIRQEKAAKSESCRHETQTNKHTRGGKRAITVKDVSISRVKTFSEILHAKKKRQEEEEQRLSPKKAKQPTDKESDAAGPGPEEVRVKTLEEIRREKAAKIQAQQAENKKSSDTEETDAKKPRLLRIKKLQSNVASEKSADVTDKPLKNPAAAPESGAANDVKVKTFEEIMQEKRLRRQEMDEQAKDRAEAEPSGKRSDGGTLKRKLPVSVTSPGSSRPPSSPDSTPSTEKLPVGKLIPVKSKAASPLNTAATRRTRGAAAPPAAAASVPVMQSSSPREAESDSCREVPDKNSKQPRAAAETRTSDKTLNNNPKNEPCADTKVRPKLNVKPSVVKPAVQLRPSQKRRGAQRSAVAAVKPLNSASTAQEEPLQETTCRDAQEFPSCSAEAQLSSAVPQSPGTLLDSGSSPPREDLQTVPVFQHSGGPETKQTARDACTVPQSPVLKTPSQPKSRRLSAAASRAAAASSAAAASISSAVDDFEDLINEFTDDHLDGDVDPAIGEDDLLQELSEMIDS